MQHPAVDGRGAVNLDYCEKTTVRFWSSVVLKRAASHHNGAIQVRSQPYQQEQLRATFRHRLRIVMSEFPTEITSHTAAGAFNEPAQIRFDLYNNAPEVASERWLRQPTLPPPRQLPPAAAAVAACPEPDSRRRPFPGPRSRSRDRSWAETVAQ